MNGDNLSSKDIRAFNHHYDLGWAVLKRVMLIGARSNAPTPLAAEAQEALAHFSKCLELSPRSWPSLWAMGKAKQAIGHHTEALLFFERAAEIAPDNADVWREASVAACAL